MQSEDAFARVRRAPATSFAELRYGSRATLSAPAQRFLLTALGPKMTPQVAFHLVRVHRGGKSINADVSQRGRLHAASTGGEGSVIDDEESETGRYRRRIDEQVDNGGY
jgi:hypothetical protein